MESATLNLTRFESKDCSAQTVRSLRALLAMWVACALLVAVAIGIAVLPPEPAAASETAPSAVAETMAQPGARGL